MMIRVQLRLSGYRPLYIAEITFNGIGNYTHTARVGRTAVIKRLLLESKIYQYNRFLNYHYY